MQVKNWSRRFLGSTISSIWHIDRKMGKDFTTLLDLVKYERSCVVLPDSLERLFRGRCVFLYSAMKNILIDIVPASSFNQERLEKISAETDVLYFLEFGRYPYSTRDYILDSCRDTTSEVSLLKIRAQKTFPIHLISTEQEVEVRLIAELLDLPVNRVPRDY